MAITSLSFANAISARPFALSYSFIAGIALIRSKLTLLKAKLAILCYISQSESSEKEGGEKLTSADFNCDLRAK